MGKVSLSRGGTTRGGSSIRGGRTRGNASGRSGASTSRSTLARGGGTSPIRSTTVARGGSTNRGKGRDPLYRNKDNSLERTASKKSEKKVYKVSLTNAVVKKLIAAKSKGVHMKINVSDKMEIDTGEGEKIQLNVSSPKKVQMIFIRNDDIVDLVGNVIGCANNTEESHIAAKRGLVKRDLVAKKLRESYEKETKGKRKVQALGYDEIPSEQEAKSKSKRQKNNVNVGPSIKVQQSPPTFVHAPSSKVAPQLLNATRGGSKHIRGKARGGRSRTVTTTEVVDVDDVVDTTTTTTSARGVNTIRGGKTTGGGKSTRGRGAKTIVSDVPKVTTTLNTQSTRGKRGRPAGTNRTTRGAKTYITTTTRTSTAPKHTAHTAPSTTASSITAPPATLPPTIIKNDNEQQSMSEGTASSSSKKGKSKANGQLATSLEWKPGQTITILTLTEFRQARKICEDKENDIQKVFEKLGEYESFYNSIKSGITKGSTNDYLLKEIEKQSGEGKKLMQLEEDIKTYLQLEKEIKTIHDELCRAASEGVYED